MVGLQVVAPVLRSRRAQFALVYRALHHTLPRVDSTRPMGAEENRLTHVTSHIPKRASNVRF